jgi:GWxTD domain-containing protein
MSNEELGMMRIEKMKKLNIYSANSFLIPKFSLLILSLVLLFTLSSTVTFAQQEGTRSLNLQVDFARFRVDNHASLIEIYYAFDRSAVEHEAGIKGFLAKYDVNLKVFFKDSLIKEIHWQGSDLAENMKDVKAGQMISDVHQLMLGTGEFSIKITVMDLNNQNQDEKILQIKQIEWPVDAVAMSDVQLGLLIKKADKKSRFTKNRYNVHPNPGQTYNTAWPNLYYYLEIYNLNVLKEDGQSAYKIVAEIKNQKGEILKTLPEKNRKLGEFTDIIEVNRALVVSMQSGFYELNISVMDENERVAATQSKSFYVYRAADQTTAKADNPKQKEDELRRLYLSKNEEELDQEFEYLGYIISSKEEDIFENLNVGGKREFFVNFWETKALLESKKRFLIRQEYMDRIEYANTKYSNSGKVGWQTDQGRIIIQYGIPDDIEKFYGGSTQKQHEIWTYDAIQGGITFVFMDITGYGIFQLIHSTANEEIQDYDWQSRYLQ